MPAAAIATQKLHTEEAVEAHFTEQLVMRQGWRERPYTALDRKAALDPEMIEEFVRTTQPDAWKRLCDQYPGKERETLVRQVEARLKAVGTLEVLRQGITIIPGIKITLCTFKPASGLNPATLRAYEGNILGVMRQVRYSLRSENAIDVVLFINGIPFAILGMGPNSPEPLHLYSMRQAVEVGFILDVLRNYQTYKSYAKLKKAIEDDPQLLERKSSRKVARFIDFHETAMIQKAEVIVEHFRRHALPELSGNAKAMVVTSSREIGRAHV